MQLFGQKLNKYHSSNTVFARLDPLWLFLILKTQIITLWKARVTFLSHQTLKELKVISSSFTKSVLKN